MSYKIIWATPWNVKSAIAKFSLQVVTELRKRGCDVIIFRTETDDGKKIAAIDEESFEVCFWSMKSVLETKHDIIICNFGDNYFFHGSILDDLKDLNLNIVGIFHDAFYCNLMNGWASKRDNQTLFLKNMVENTYNCDCEDFSFWRDFKFMSQNYPLTEFLAASICGAVCHADHYFQRVSDACPGPVKKIPLCMKFGNSSIAKVEEKDIFTLAVIGHANPNKRIEQLLTAIGNDDFLKRHYKLKSIGPVEIEYRNKLEALASKLHLIPPEFTGWISDECLEKSLEDIDVIACLREPILEGGSASLIFAMQSGRPTLVLNHGVYAEVPDNCVFKCNLNDEIKDIQKYLKWIYENYKNALEIASNANLFSKKWNSVEAYVDELMPLIDESILSMPTIKAAKSLGAILSDFGCNTNDQAITRIGAVFDDLFNKNDLSEGK